MSLLKRHEGNNSVISLVAVSTCLFCAHATRITLPENYQQLIQPIVLSIILCPTNCNAGALHSRYQPYQQGSSRIPRTGIIILLMCQLKVLYFT